MNEGAPNIPTSETTNQPEVTESLKELRKKCEAMTREEAMEAIIEPSIEKALDVQAQIQDLLEEQREKAKLTEADENVVVIHDQAAWNTYKDLLEQRRSYLQFIPGDLCMDKELPYHPSDNNKKISYATTEFPSSAESDYAHTLDYQHASSGDDYPRVDQQQTN